jgi:hypothetical protein
VIGTFKYSAFALNLIRSIREKHERKDVEIHLFSDNCVRNAELTYESINFHTVTHEEWPFSTLNRFKYILSKQNLYRGSHLIYIDADALLRGNLLEIVEAKRLTFVAHPGFWRERKILSRKSKTSLGGWETRSEQLSFIPLEKRKNYICGGVWFGPTDEVINMCEVLYEIHLKDLGMNQIPVWHDESYVNWYNSNFECDVVNPRFAYVRNYSHLSNLTPVVEVLDKPSGWIRD